MSDNQDIAYKYNIGDEVMTVFDDSTVMSDISLKHGSYFPHDWREYCKGRVFTIAERTTTEYGRQYRSTKNIMWIEEDCIVPYREISTDGLVDLL